MEIKITSRHDKISQSLQEAITKDINSLNKFFDRITSCHVVLDTEHIEKKVEINMGISGHNVVATGKADNIGKAFDDALSKVERQLKKVNQKIKNHKSA